MNGVRRFFAATNVVAPSPSPPPPAPKDEPGAPPPKPFSLPPITPLSISGGKQVFPPPKSSPSSTDQFSSPPTSPGTAPAGLFVRKDGPTSPRRKPVKVDVKPSANGARPSFDSFGSSPRSSTPPPITPPSKVYANGNSKALRNIEPLQSSQIPSWKSHSNLVNTKDELLMSLLASEAMVDSREFEILSAEDVEELKREQQLLSSRLVATRKKLALETKIRDAAANLQKLQTVKRLSKQTSEQLESANRKVDLATKELSQLLERTSEIDRRLLEHRAGVLGLSLRNLEAKVASEHADAAGDSLPASRGLNSPASSVTSSTNRTKFDGAHLFAGHADSVVPGSLRKKAVDSAQVAALETRLKEAEGNAQSAHEKASILEKQLEQIQMEKAEVEKNLDFDLQTAQETIMKMEREMAEMEQALGQHEDIEQARQEWEDERKKWQREREEWEKERQSWNLQDEDIEQARQEWEDERKKWQREREEWEKERQSWNLQVEDWEEQRRGWDRQHEEWEQERQGLQADVESRNETISRLERRLTDLEADATKGTGLDEQLRARDAEIERLLNTTQDDKQRWESQKILWQKERREEVDRVREESSALATAAKEELDAGLQVLYGLIRNHRIVASPTDSSLSGYAAAISSHVGSINMRLEQLEQEKVDLDAMRKKYEEDVRNGWEIRDRLGREVEDARKEREDARKEVRMLEMQLRDTHQRSQSVSSIRSATPPALAPIGKTPDDVNKVITPLRALWSVLPSVEARAQKMGKPSLADLDVRTLKSLYDPKAGFNSPTVSGSFDIDVFVARVQALIADDRALIERLLRFAQSHDLLRNNAERAQKLAQDSNKGLELYQAQVKSLEDRNAALTRKQLSMLDEIGNLQQSIDMVTQEKRELEGNVEELNEKIRQLEALGGRGAKGNPAVEAEAAALKSEKSKLETQVANLQKQLDEANREMDRIRESDAIQQMALLDELNSLQQENGKLRDQLRAKK